MSRILLIMWGGRRYKMDIKEIFKKAIEKNITTIKEFNEGIYVYVIYRIVWETQSHYILYAVGTEDEAVKFIEEHNPNEYFYQKLKIN